MSAPPSALTILTPEIWSSITYRIPTAQLGRMKLTGAKLLWERLTAPRSVRRIRLGTELLRVKRWPAFVSDLRGGEELIIKLHDSIKWLDWTLKLDMVPNTLRKLTIDAGYFSIVSFFTHSSGTAFSPKDLVPKLESLCLKLSVRVDYAWMSQMPQSLYHLELTGWYSNTPPPSSVGSLKVNHIMCQDLPRPLLPKLESLELLSLDDCPVVPLLSPELVSFKLRLGNGSGFDLISKLPRNLIVANLGLAGDELNDYTVSDPQTVFAFPSTLTELSLSYIIPRYWRYFPPTLKTLKIRSCPLILPSKNMTDPILYDPIPFQSLPKCLETFKLNISWDRAYLHLNELPEPIAKVIFRLDYGNTTVNSTKFTASLTHLKMTEIHLSVEMAKSLPPSLTNLELGYLDEEVCEYLPRRLLKFEVGSLLALTPNFMRYLPPSLTELDLTKAMCDTNWFNSVTGKIENVEEISSKTDHIWTGAFHLPHLRRLTLDNFKEVNKNFLMQPLESLTYLKIHGIPPITDECIPHLPRGLHTLILPDCPNLTGRCFTGLPRHLTYLNMQRLVDVQDDLIQHLPATLTHLRLDNRTPLTDGCAKFLPRQLRSAHFGGLTPAAFNDLPIGIRHPINKLLKNLP